WMSFCSTPNSRSAAVTAAIAFELVSVASLTLLALVVTHTRDLYMIRGRGNVALSGHDHSPFRCGLCLQRLRLDAVQQNGRRTANGNAPRGDLKSRHSDDYRHGHDDLHACRPESIDLF